MSDELVEIEGIKIKREQVDLVKRTIFLNASDDELRLFFYECARRGVHPMDRLIFPVVRIDKEGNRRVAFQTGIDYLRAAAEETGRYVGQKTIEYGPEIPIEGHPEIKVPEWATAMVLRKDPESGEVVEVPHTVRWKEYYPGEKLGFMWRKMPYGQLGKCAEAGSLRKGFPRKLGGLYVNEEMERAEAVPFSDATRKPIEKPQEKKTETTSHTANLITDAQCKRFYAIAKSRGATDDAIKAFLKNNYGWTSTNEITRELYEEACERVKTLFEVRQPGED